MCIAMNAEDRGLKMANLKHAQNAKGKVWLCKWSIWVWCKCKCRINAPLAEEKVAPWPQSAPNVAVVDSSTKTNKSNLISSKAWQVVTPSWWKERVNRCLIWPKEILYSPSNKRATIDLREWEIIYLWTCKLLLRNLCLGLRGVLSIWMATNSK